MKPKIILFAICMVALAGFFLPWVTVQFSLLNMGRTANFSLATLFESDDPVFGDDGFARSGVFDIIDVDFFELIDDVMGVIIRSAVLYVAAFVLLIVVAVFSLLGKFKTVSLGLHVLAMLSFLFASYSVSTVPDILLPRIRGMLGFFSIFINPRDILTISFGAGFWVTVVAMGVLLLARPVIAFLTREAAPAPAAAR